MKKVSKKDKQDGAMIVAQFLGHSRVNAGGETTVITPDMAPEGSATTKTVFIAPYWVHKEQMHLVDTKTVRAVR